MCAEQLLGAQQVRNPKTAVIEFRSLLGGTVVIYEIQVILNDRQQHIYVNRCFFQSIHKDYVVLRVGGAKSLLWVIF